MTLDIDERHLLRLGHGEEALETDKDFSRYATDKFFYFCAFFDLIIIF